MPKFTLAALLGSTFLVPIAAHADSQCVSLPTGEPVAAPRTSTPAVPPAALPPPVQTALASPEPVSAHAPETAPPSPALSAADKIKATGIHEMTPDEIARIPGLGPVVRAGARIFVIGNGAGVTNVIAVNGDHFQAFTPMGDPHYLCRGMVQDDQGNSVTLAEASKIPGLVAPPGHPAIAPITSPDAAISAVAKAGYGTFGVATAPVVWVVIDPLCVHSQQAIKDLLPYAKDGKIRLNIMPVSVISPQSAPAARVLLSVTPDRMFDRWFAPGILAANYDVASADKLDQNNRVFAGLAVGMKVAGVPEILWTSRGVSQAKSGLDTAEVPDFIASLWN